MNYSIQYKNVRAIAARSKLLSFATDVAAMDQGRQTSGCDAIVEVWRGNHLLVRLFGADIRKPVKQEFSLIALPAN